MPPERLAGCPVCSWVYGFHDRQKHDVLSIDPKLFKEKDWHKIKDKDEQHAGNSG